jgi:hypothetical protein
MAKHRHQGELGVFTWPHTVRTIKEPPDRSGGLVGPLVSAALLLVCLLGGLLVEEEDLVLGTANGDLGPDLFDPVGLKLIVAKLAFDMDQGSLLQALFDRIDLALFEDFDGVPGGAGFALAGL